MVTYSGVSKTEDTYCYCFHGLSTDDKPTLEQFPEMRNGSKFIEMDTKKLFYWDAESEDWI